MSFALKLSALLLTCPVIGIKLGAQFHKGQVHKLEADSMFAMDWVEESPPGCTPEMALVASDGHCDSFVGNGFSCYIENPEHALIHRWIPPNATVLEFGARFGTTTCELAKKLDNSGRVVAVEPDTVVWDWLDSNLKKHNCHAHALHGAISSKPLHMTGSGYGGRSDVTMLRGKNQEQSHTVPTFTFDEVEKASGLKFDTLLIDCEGCAQDMMDQLAPKIQTQINLIVIEADMPDSVIQEDLPQDIVTTSDCTKHCMNYRKFFEFLYKSGFERIDMFNDCDRTRSMAPESSWCGEWINHYAFRKKGLAYDNMVNLG